jgi:hypothetical protein
MSKHKLRAVSDFRITNHGVSHSQYFQGHGVSFSKFETCATGIGMSEKEALDDALEQLACAGEFDIAALEETAEFKEAAQELTDADLITPILQSELKEDESLSYDDCEVHVFVSVDIIGPSAAVTGPWTVEDHIHYEVFGPTGQVAAINTELSQGEALAIARLVAAAPGLLAALEEILSADRLSPGDCYDTNGNPNENWGSIDRAKAKARTAIANARGLK